MSKLAELATNFFVFVFYAAVVAAGGSAIVYAVGETVEHFTP